jgi:hypothetical protein
MVVSRFYNMQDDKFVLTFCKNIPLSFSGWLKFAQVDAALMGGDLSIIHDGNKTYSLFPFHML